MAVCYLFANYEVQYKCKYNITKDFIEVETDYDIEEEIEAENGLKLLGSHTQFKERDILIIDYQNKSNFLLKNARYVGRSSVYGTPDGGRKTKFRTRNYFRHGDYVAIEKSEKEYVIILSKEKLNNIIELNSNGIKNIVVSDDWTSKRDKTGDFIINFNGYIEINLTRMYILTRKNRLHGRSEPL